MKWLVGIDEAGRGPLAGPVAVGIVKAHRDFDWEELSGVNDSKQLSEAKRVMIYEQAKDLRHYRKLDFSVSMVGSSYIDKHGIVPAVNLAIARCIKRLKLDSQDCHILLDGGLVAPEIFSQETIIKGDGKEKTIGLASILAKVTRDKYMDRIGRQYILYGFSTHKGYGTKKHREQIQRHGKCPIHRVSYCKNIKTL